jgi:hypothetical protein
MLKNKNYKKSEIYGRLEDELYTVINSRKVLGKIFKIQDKIVKF